MQRNFVEAGRASQLVALGESAGVPLAQEQRDLTAFQRMVLVKELERQHEEADSGQQMHGRSQVPNSAAAGPDKSIQGETVEYINEGA